MLPHPIVRVTNFRQVGPYTLWVEFDDGHSHQIDFRPVLEGQIYGPLRDEPTFAQVRIDRESHTLAWPNDADFDPATLRHWPEYLPHLIKMVERWKNSPSAAAS
jgi:hypothetical protein